MTTRDASVTDVVNGRVLLVKVQDGFTQEESLSYLANCLNISEEELPEQADQIYSESKGNVQKCFDSRFSTGEPIDEIKIECNFNMKKNFMNYRFSYGAFIAGSTFGRTQRTSEY